jgi:peptidoglycan hydrolase-like protein with peptidoglycan-binding domain
MSQGKAAGPAGMAMDKEKVKQLQEALKSKGHDPGPIDGIMGPKTQAALRDYQQKENVQSRADALQKLGVQQ